MSIDSHPKTTQSDDPMSIPSSDLGSQTEDSSEAPSESLKLDVLDSDIPLNTEEPPIQQSDGPIGTSGPLGGSNVLNKVFSTGETLDALIKMLSKLKRGEESTADLVMFMLRALHEPEIVAKVMGLFKKKDNTAQAKTVAVQDLKYLLLKIISLACSSSVITLLAVKLSGG